MRASGKIAHHDREWLAVAMLALSQAHDSFFAGCIHAEMKTADAFDGHDFASEKSFNRFSDWVGTFDRDAFEGFPARRADHSASRHSAARESGD